MFWKKLKRPNQLKWHHSADIFSDNIELNIYDRPYLNLVKISMFVGIRNDGHLKTIVGRITNRKVYSIYSNRAFIHRHIATFGHFLVKIISESKIPAPSASFTSVHTAVWSTCPWTICPSNRPFHHHTAFQIHFTTHCQHAQICAIKRFLNGCNCVSFIGKLHHCKTHSIVGYTLINL